MQPCLLLTLALLGTASASHPAPRHPQEVPARVAEEGHRFRYTVVTQHLTYAGAQRYCREVLRGQLPSVHSASRNQELANLARTYTYRALWIGAVTSSRALGAEAALRQGGSQWEDGSPWNYANWAPTQPCRIFTTCTTLSTFDGLWRSSFCFQLHPFICQY
ncbi:bone marrow proteoglycan-like [Gavia stellata]|uniref:bone marrow proteoglycan-like n=1 Tax=Gavia stellata TaxID=37040 RepID=UPI0028A0490C|nr:bone marrow proteoglycan-like [Gavia stellata]